MKRIITLLIALMMLSIATFSFAITSTDDIESTDILAKYNGSDPVDVYSIDVVWGGMKYDYNAAPEVWNSTTHRWEASENGTWTVQKDSSNTITVVNHSSVAVSVNMATANMMSGISGMFTNGSFNLDIPNEGENGATYNSASFMPAGILSAEYKNDTKIGEIIVSIN